MGTVVEIMPIELSGDTKRNAYCHYCPVTEQRHGYSLCLHKMALRKVGRLKEDWSDCSVAIGKKTCPAIDMKEREVEKNQALYFVERMTFIGIEAFINAAKELFTAKPKKRAPTIRAATVKPVDELDLDIDGGGYQDAITKSVAARVAVPSVSHKPGESLIDIAKRMMAAKQ